MRRWVQSKRVLTQYHHVDSDVVVLRASEDFTPGRDDGSARSAVKFVSHRTLPRGARLCRRAPAQASCTSSFFVPAFERKPLSARDQSSTPDVRSVRRVLQTGAALTSTVIHYEDAVYEIHTAQNRQYLLTDDDRVCAYFESHRKGTVSSSLLPRAVSNPSRRRSILARA